MVPLPLRAADLDPKPAFHDLVRTYFHGALKPPFNEEKRAEAGLPPDFYWPLADGAACAALTLRTAALRGKAPIRTRPIGEISLKSEHMAVISPATG
jgi:hypothetical protein